MESLKANESDDETDDETAGKSGRERKAERMTAATTTPALANDAQRGSHSLQRLVGHPSNVLNLYAGVGGNRKLWQDVNVTAVENEPKIAAVYQRLHPNDTVIIGDAHAYLLENYHRFDFIWTSPPCQTHSKMAKATRHKLKRYPDMSLYQQIIFLRTYAKCPWVVENVVPYYAPLIPPTKQIGRHLFWANFDFEASEVPQPANFINRCNVAGKLAMQDWLGIHYPENIYYGSNHCPAQILRNCVHPLLGAQILAAARMPNTKISHAEDGASNRGGA